LEKAQDRLLPWAKVSTILAPIRTNRTTRTNRVNRVNRVNRTIWVCTRLAVFVAALALPAAGCKRHPSGAPALPPVAVLPPAPVAPAARQAPPNGRRIQHVVIISEDGLRPDALMDVLPPVHAEIMKHAAYSLQARTIRRASTLPSHAAMLSGFDVKQHGLYWNSWKPERGYILVPTIFDAAEQSGMHAAAFVGKQKLEHIAHPGSVDVFSRPGYFCKKVVEEAAQYFVEKRPQIEFIHFSDPDDLGHSDGWMSNPQLEAVRHTDRCLRTLLDATAAAGLDRDTLFIISADHGGHGHNHSGKIKEDRLIPWIAWGPGVRSGHRILAPISTVDTAATTLWALGYPPTPGAIGRPVLEAFDPATIAISGPKPKPVF
jgi:Type I phosphodiesterase / nucleotide pyrophosphatase